LSSACASNSVSVIIPAHNEGANLRPTVESLLAGLPADGEIIVVDDVSIDGSAEALDGLYGGVRVLRSEARLGVGGARTAGLRQARGETIVFSDAHVRAPLGWAAAICEVLSQPDAGAVSPAISAMGNANACGYGLRWRDAALNVDWLGKQADGPYPAPLLCGCFMGIRREVFETAGGFDDGLTTWGFEDVELSLRLWLLGYQCLVLPQITVGHLFRDAHPYSVPWDIVLHNLLRVAFVHFGAARLERVTATIAANPAFPQAFARLAEGDAHRLRDELRARRVHDDDWYFDRFGITW
jgi:GT2 family glycosyltransferase